MMALKMLYRGPSSRLENLIEKIQATKEIGHNDMYSTHTSSSYSPSISDGTLTPNSLHHHHHAHLPAAQHMQHHLHQLQHDEEHSLRHLNQNTHKTTNGTAAPGESDAGAAAEHDDDIIVDTKLDNAAAAAADNNNGVKRQVRHNHSAGMKVPTKLRKIDRDGIKFDKSTGDGIKQHGSSSNNNNNNNSSTDGSYQCQFCDKSFPRLGYLKKHEQSHAEHLPFRCEYCARLFKHKRSRDRHTKLHTGDRRYKCPHCEAAFSRSDHLKIHMKTHDNQKPFQCTICNRGYNTAAALTSHMQNHKKQAAILAAGGNPHALNYSPRSTGSASSNGSLNKRRYAMATIASDSSPSRLEYPTKRLRGAVFLNCTYCTKADFNSLEQLNTHIQAMHEKELAATATTAAGSTTPLSVQNSNNSAEINAFQLACEYCTMKFPNIQAMFQHIRTTHIDRLTSPNSYFEHFNRLAASGTFSPRLVANKPLQRLGSESEHSIKLEQQSVSSPRSSRDAKQQEEEPTDLSTQSKRRSETPTPSTPPSRISPHTPEKPGVFLCNQCNAGLPDFESFRNHLKSHITKGFHLVCHHCGLSLREQADYERHIISHFLITNSEYNCSGNCNKSYAKPEELQKHLLEQHVVQMFKCSICSDLFESKVAIQVHFACAHSSETKLLRCSACMEVFRTETDFNMHVKTRHQATVNAGHNPNSGNSLQCMFCRTICSSDLEMHFHLAAHARQFRCPSCPETFHVEFLLDRHMQSHHGGKESAFEDQAPPTANPNPISPMNSLYVNALFGKAPLLPLAAQHNNNNNILDYNVAFAAHLNKGLFPAANKFYSPLQVDTSAMKHHPALMYGLSQRYFDTNRTLMDMYAQHQQDKANAGNYFISPKPTSAAQQTAQDGHNRTPTEIASVAAAVGTGSAIAGYSCDICERNDFRNEAEVHSHRKIVHNMKTGVSLRCAYCSGNFKSRSELEHHMKTCHNSTGKHKCLICDEIFPSPAILAEHKLQHSKVGQSGKCSHCAKPLNDVAAFKEHLVEHNNEGQLPVQCICCRQSMHSEIEIGLHAKFHTKSSNMPEHACALCLEAIPNGNTETKVCDKCCRKHNLNAKYSKNRMVAESFERHNEIARHYVENRCNLCKMILPHAHKLQEHLVEHTFAGCEDRGFICYICSAVFTAPGGLLGHMQEHGLNARPYDCNLCTEKYFFRAELEHHLVEHELRQDMGELRQDMSELRRDEVEYRTPKEETPMKQTAAEKGISVVELALTEVKKELLDEAVDSKSNVGDDDEYIEVEKVIPATTEKQGQQQKAHNSLVQEGEGIKIAEKRREEV